MQSRRRDIKTVTKTFEFKAVKADGMFIDGEDPWVEDGTLYLLCNPKLDGKDFVVKVDGTDQQAVYNTSAYNMNLSGDYIYYMNYKDENSSDYTVCIYRVKNRWNR